ncbi:MAG: tripartite tricarboxylate transporter substrate binding protein [Burkholderiales bacterium]|jgi:tripartite-type tricarboxylate transporter receptor subunit TctC|nr:tripartite tricarboxylate transporter substrate binding protein [Burkholderiales bacterium]
MRIILTAIATLLALYQPVLATAADISYPTRPVRLVVPYAPGGGSDITGRMLGQKLSERLGQTFVIDTRPGAASLIGTEIVAKAAGDGYTLILADVPHTINAVMFAKPPYDALKDFSPIMRVATTPQVFAAHPSFKANSLKELIAMPRAQTEKLALGTSGQGGSPHMTYELLRIKTGLVLNHVPYKGGGPAISDLVANQIPLALNGSPPVVPHIKAGRIKGLAMSGATRHPLLPGVPTFIESGVPDFVVAHWYGVLASGGTPPAIVKLLHQELARALEQPDVKERFASLALDIAPLGPDEFRKLIEADVKRWKEVVTQSGIKPN